jgi:hypothetical protein
VACIGIFHLSPPPAERDMVEAASVFDITITQTIGVKGYRCYQPAAIKQMYFVLRRQLYRSIMGSQGRCLGATSCKMDIYRES